MAIYVSEQSAPATPSSGNVVIYAKTDGNVYEKDDTGTETQLFNSNPLTLDTAQTTTSGSAFDYSGLRSGLKRIDVIFAEVSLSGTDHVLVQIGDSGGLETTSYISTSNAIDQSGGSSGTNSTSGFVVSTGASAASVLSGVLTLTHIGSNQWIAHGVFKISTTGVIVAAGSHTLTGTLDRLRITRTGTDSFDAGSVNILYE